LVLSQFIKKIAREARDDGGNEAAQDENVNSRPSRDEGHRESLLAVDAKSRRDEIDDVIHAVEKG
jgi:hypothetical protein